MRSRRESGEVDLAHADILTPSWRVREHATAVPPSSTAVTAAPAGTDDGEDSDEAYVILHEPLAEEERRRWTGTPAASDAPASPPATALGAPTSPVVGGASLKRARSTGAAKPCVPLYPPPLACWQTVRAAVKRHRDEAGAALHHRRVVRRRRRALATIDSPLHAFAVIEGAFNREKLKLRRLLNKKRGGPQRPGGGWSAARIPPSRSPSLSPPPYDPVAGAAAGGSGSHILTAAEKALRREHLDKELVDEDLPLHQAFMNASPQPPAVAAAAAAAASSSMHASNVVIDVDMEPPARKAADIAAVTSLSSTPSPSPSPTPSPGPSPPPAGITQLPMPRNHPARSSSIAVGSVVAAAPTGPVAAIPQPQWRGSAIQTGHASALHAREAATPGANGKQMTESGSTTVNKKQTGPVAAVHQNGDRQAAGVDVKRDGVIGIAKTSGGAPAARVSTKDATKDATNVSNIAKEEPGGAGVGSADASVASSPVSKSIQLLEQAAADFEEIEQFYRSKAKRFLYQLKSLSTQAGWEPSKPLNFINLQKDFAAIKREESASVATEGSDRIISIGSYIRRGLDESTYPVLSKSLTLRPGYRLHGAPLTTGEEYAQEPVVNLDVENGGSFGGIPPASPGTPKASGPATVVDLDDDDDDANSLEGFDLNMMPLEGPAPLWRRARAATQSGAGTGNATGVAARNSGRPRALAASASTHVAPIPINGGGASAAALLSHHYQQRQLQTNRGPASSAGRAGGSIAVTVRPSQGLTARNSGAVSVSPAAPTGLRVHEKLNLPLSSPGLIARGNEDADRIAAQMMMASSSSGGGNLISTAPAVQSTRPVGATLADTAGHGVSAVPSAPSEATGPGQSLQPFLSLARNAGAAAAVGGSSPAARTGPITGVIGVDVARSVPAPVPAPTVGAIPAIAPARATTPSSPSTPTVTVTGSPAGNPTEDVVMKVDEEKEGIDSDAMKLGTDEQLELSQDPDKSSNGGAEVAKSSGVSAEVTGESGRRNDVTIVHAEDAAVTTVDIMRPI